MRFNSIKHAGQIDELLHRYAKWDDIYISERGFKSGFASGFVSDYIDQCMVGNEELAVQILQRAPAWLNWVIDRDERFGVNWHLSRSGVHIARALCTWLQHEVDDKDDWALAMHHSRQAWCEGDAKFGSKPWLVRDIIGDPLDDYMAAAVQGGSVKNGLWHEAIETYERLLEGKNPTTLSNVKRPRDLAYLLCQKNLGLIECREADLLKVGRSILRRFLDYPWLSGGQHLRAAVWLKIVYWDYDQRVHGDFAKLTPIETLHMAYHDIKDAVVPETVTLPPLPV